VNLFTLRPHRLDDREEDLWPISDHLVGIPTYRCCKRVSPEQRMPLFGAGLSASIG